MGIIKIKNHVKDKDDYLSNLIRYIIEGEAPSGLYGSPNTEYRSAEIAIKQMNQVKTFFGKNSLKTIPAFKIKRIITGWSIYWCKHCFSTSF